MELAAKSVVPIDDSPRRLVRQLLILALPVFAEHSLHILVGMNDGYLANHLHHYDAATAATRFDENAAGAAVGTMSYFLWFVGLLVSGVATGSTAIISRAIGAKHRRLANSVCGQSILLAGGFGVVSGICMYFAADFMARISGLAPEAHHYAFLYLRILSISLPLSMIMFVANACLRGAGDTLSPAITMCTVDIINMAFSFGLTYGWCGLPKMGFVGIAWGTTIAYLSGGIIQLCVLGSGRGGIRLFRHRLLPNLPNMRRILRIGLPGGAADILQWIANYVVVFSINTMGAIQGNAHNLAVRVESMSFMMGFAISVAVTTMVGQSLGMGQPRRAFRSALVAYAVGGGFMVFCGLMFIFFGKYPAAVLASDEETIKLIAGCLRVTGCTQIGFAAAVVFGGALRGAGDTVAVMVLTFITLFGIRVCGTIFATRYLHVGLVGLWVVLSIEVFCRGLLISGRFFQGKWKAITV